MGGDAVRLVRAGEGSGRSAAGRGDGRLVWSGWVGIGGLTGFGVVRPLPGIWDSLRLDTAVTLPVGVEAYAAYALRAWLSASPVMSGRTRRFARWSAMGSLGLGMAGQVAWHLLVQAHVTRAPWEVTTGVSCLPVLVLGMGAALAHLLRADAMPRGGPALVRTGTDRADQAGGGGLVIREDRLAGRGRRRRGCGRQASGYRGGRCARPGGPGG